MIAIVDVTEQETEDLKNSVSPTPASRNTAQSRI